MMSVPTRSTASVIARAIASVRITGSNRRRPSSVALALGLLISPAACTGSPTTLALQPDFTMATPVGITSVSVRESLPGLTDHEFEEMVRTGMEGAEADAVLPGPVQPPFPQFRIVWHVNPVGHGGTSRLVVNIFKESVPFAYEQAVVDNSAPTVAIVQTIESMTRRLSAFDARAHADAPA
jgi:hypothetical protein